MRAMTNGALSRFNPGATGRAGDEGGRDRPAAGDGGSLRSRAERLSRSILARLHQSLRRSGDGRRARRLVRGDGAVPPSARPADPAHRDHPAQQGPDRRGARNFPQGEFPDPVGGRAADAATSTLRARSGRFLQSPSQEEQSRIRAGASRLIADVFESLDDERLGGIVKGAISSRLRAWRCRPSSATRSPRRSTRTGMCRCLRRRSAGPPARSTPTSS